MSRLRRVVEVDVGNGVVVPVLCDGVRESLDDQRGEEELRVSGSERFHERLDLEAHS